MRFFRVNGPDPRTDSTAWKVVAFLFHAPGLWAIYGYVPPRRLAVINVAAISVTLAAAIAAWWFVNEPWRLPSTIGTWAFGHVASGVFLATKHR